MKCSYESESKVTGKRYRSTHRSFLMTSLFMCVMLQYLNIQQCGIAYNRTSSFPKSPKLRVRPYSKSHHHKFNSSLLIYYYIPSDLDGAFLGVQRPRAWHNGQHCPCLVVDAAASRQAGLRTNCSVSLRCMPSHALTKVIVWK